MFIFDLHCDTAFETMDKRKSLLKNDLHIDLLRGEYIKNWIQVFAFWIDDIYEGQNAFDMFLIQRDYFLNQIKKNSNKIELYAVNNNQKKCRALTAVEGGHILGGDLNKIEQLAKLKILYLTLTWNGDNEIGSGVNGSNKGLTSFGKQAVKELQKHNIIVDVSHLNQKGFYDVCDIATKPIMASHSNSKKIFDHKRNLTDEQLDYLIQNNGLCGINIYPLFINGKKDCTLKDIHKHIDHILSLGGEDILALGTDFDGAKMPSCLNGVQMLYKLYNYMIKWYGEQVAKKMMFDNALNFIKKTIQPEWSKNYVI